MVVYDRSDPGTAKVIIGAESDFDGNSPKLFWPELNQTLTLIVAMKSETTCEPELLLIAGMNDHLHAAGLLERLINDEPTPKKTWEAIQTLFASMNDVQEMVASGLRSKTKVLFVSSQGYAGMPPALQFMHAMLILMSQKATGFGC